ncbi:MAG: hypothetical protein O3A46_02125 [Candidatus Poribacteria bacterium]|nr:hypothetical protein [Candidatus Poribacteria bacterium]
MAIHEPLTEVRKTWADRVFGGWTFPVSAAEVSRVSAWMCLFGAVARFQGSIGWAFGWLAAALVLDVFDGVVARQRGENSPEIDWAADRFGELVFVGAVLARDPLWVGLTFAGGYVANVFLPIRRIPVLPLRHALGVYFIARLAMP